LTEGRINSIASSVMHRATLAAMSRATSAAPACIVAVFTAINHRAPFVCVTTT
jgi:hypothetical protein